MRSGRVGGGARATNYDYTKGQLPELIDIIIEEGAKLFVSAVGVPPKYAVDKLHAAGIPVMNMIGAPKHVAKALPIALVVHGREGEGEIEQFRADHLSTVGEGMIFPYDQFSVVAPKGELANHWRYEDAASHWATKMGARIVPSATKSDSAFQHCDQPLKMQQLKEVHQG